MAFNLKYQVNVQFTPETDLTHFSEQLKASEGNDVRQVEFYTITGARVPLCEKVQDLNDYPILLQINKKRIFALNFSEEFEVERKSSKDVTSEEYYYDFASGIGLKGYQRYFLPNFAARLMNSLPESKQEVSGKEVGHGIAHVLRYMENKHYRNDLGNTNERLDHLQTRVEELRPTVAATEERIKALAETAARKSTVVCLFGSSIVLGQFGFIASGTFHYACWDIMEPLCYLMTLGNFTFGFFFYILAKKDLELSNFHDILTHRFKMSACKRAGIDMEAHERSKEELARIERELVSAYNIY